MTDLKFEFEWADPEGIRGPEISATWAQLSIAVRGSAITRLLDYRAKSFRDSIYVPLYPLAEWLAANWWFLASEFQNPYKQNRPEFRRRHSLGANRDGYAFPELEVFSSGTKTTLIWTGGAPAWTRIEFLDRGQATIDASDFFQSSYDLIDSVIRRLDAQGVGNTYLHDEWAAIQATQRDADELEFCETAAGLGWDPYNVDDAKSKDILMLADKLGELTKEAVQAIDANDLKTQTAAIVAAVDAAKTSVIPFEKIRSSSNRPGWDANGALPWHEGYQRARELRRKLNLDGQPLHDMATLAQAFGEDEALLLNATEPSFELAKAPLIDGLTTLNHNDEPSFAFRPSGEHGRRFRLCRAVGETVTCPRSAAILTRSNSERQRRNRAFAAEFLAPARSLREKVTGIVVDDDEISDLAEEYGVSSYVIGHQIQNHQIAELANPIRA